MWKGVIHSLHPLLQQAGPQILSVALEILQIGWPEDDLHMTQAGKPCVDRHCFIKRLYKGAISGGAGHGSNLNVQYIQVYAEIKTINSKGIR